MSWGDLFQGLVVGMAMPGIAFLLTYGVWELVSFIFKAFKKGLNKSLNLFVRLVLR
ncbi:hypothetical protein [Campylobacter vulpis]|uniref:hypothetical protein n=1 Tax=Campylobacter vulpis TaxID=1655500 RepID=UPI0015DEB29C|nr:hypothetical protein [Campylobacter vulpis]QNF77841.1 hypothetical protein CVULP_0807 [Campylobacter vulpis]